MQWVPPVAPETGVLGFSPLLGSRPRPAMPSALDERDFEMVNEDKQQGREATSERAAEDRQALIEKREQDDSTLDDEVADSFPASDPPSFTPEKA